MTKPVIYDAPQQDEFGKWSIIVDGGDSETPYSDYREAAIYGLAEKLTDEEKRPQESPLQALTRFIRYLNGSVTTATENTSHGMKFLEY